MKVEILRLRSFTDKRQREMGVDKLGFLERNDRDLNGRGGDLWTAYGASLI